MSDPVKSEACIPVWQYVLRLVWVVVQFLLVYSLGKSGAQFFYQGF